MCVHSRAQSCAEDRQSGRCAGRSLQYLPAAASEDVDSAVPREVREVLRSLGGGEPGGTGVLRAHT